MRISVTALATIVSCLAAYAHSRAAQAPSLTILSLDSNGVQGNGISSCACISGDGRYVAFLADASNLVPGDTNGKCDVFVRDRRTGTTERVSVASDGTQSNGVSDSPAISDDGRYVAFRSDASNLVPGDTNGVSDVFVHDRWTGRTTRVSTDSAGAQGDWGASYSSLSADGRFVAFESDASNLVPGDTNHTGDVFVKDQWTGQTVRVSVDSAGAEGNWYSGFPSISGDERCVAFVSFADNLVPGDTNLEPDAFVHDLSTGQTSRVSVDSGGGQANGFASLVSISLDGRYVAFYGDSSNLVPGDTNGQWDVFLHDRRTARTTRVSVDSNGAESDGPSTFQIGARAVSADGRWVAFDSDANNLDPSYSSGSSPLVFLHDMLSGRTRAVSVGLGGLPTDNLSSGASLSSGGRFLVFDSVASDLVPSDLNGFCDVFLYERDLTEFTSLCEPGVDGVHSCPCANPPSGSGRGCDNSSATGGASLAATGVASLATDTLVFTASGEMPAATSILMQGIGTYPPGVVTGQGVRCLSGFVVRLYTKLSVSGSITAPDFGAGEPSVSERSAGLGDPIPAGQSRWYLVYYRDPTVLGGCPAASTFNSTQTGRVDWSP